LGIFGGALPQVRGGQSRWRTKKFGVACSKVQALAEKLCASLKVEVHSPLAIFEAQSLHFEATCPVCHSGVGPRKPDRYFTDWPHACKVQTGNLLYETGLILWGVLVGLPDWASAPFLQQLNDLRIEIRQLGKSMDLFECPKCGRLTTCLYGNPEPERNGFCRWCLDMGGGVGFGFSLEFDPEGKPVFEMVQWDPAAPAKNAWDILPPEISQRLGDKLATTRSP
jgi:hypothetical protein